MTQTNQSINLAGFEGTVLSGRNRGQTARSQFKVDKLDESADTHIKVSIPGTVKIITSSFFLGLFGPSILKLGSKTAFKDKYQIDASDAIATDADQYIDLALQRKALFGDR